jgi:aminoacrylate hydrolase
MSASDPPAFDIHDGPDAGAETILLSSGLGGTAGYWTPQIDTLRQRYRTITYDHAGTGRARIDLPPDYRVEAMADEAASVLDASGSQTVHFVGHALGGLIGIALAQRRPGRVRSLTVVNGWAKASDHTRRCFDARLALLRHEGPQAYLRAQPIFLYPADWLALNESRIAGEEAHALASFQGAANLTTRIAALLAFDARPGLAALRLPTFIVAARDDMLVPSLMSEELAAAIPGACLHVEPWGGHAINITKPEAFNAQLIAFLALA